MGGCFAPVVWADWGVPLSAESLGMRGMGIPTAWTGRGTSLGQQECRTCPEGARDVLQVRLWAPGSPCSTSAHAQTPLAARSQVAPLGPAPQVCSPEGGLPKTNYVGTAPLPPARAASECPSLGTARLLPQLGAQGTEGVPPSPSHVPSWGTGVTPLPTWGAGPVGAHPPPHQGFLRAGWVPGSGFGTNNGSPGDGSPGPRGILGAAAPLPQPPAPGSGRGTRAPAALPALAEGGCQQLLPGNWAHTPSSNPRGGGSSGACSCMEMCRAPCTVLGVSVCPSLPCCAPALCPPGGCSPAWL